MHGIASDSSKVSKSFPRNLVSPLMKVVLLLIKFVFAINEVFFAVNAGFVAIHERRFCFNVVILPMMTFFVLLLIKVVSLVLKVLGMQATGGRVDRVSQFMQKRHQRCSFCYQ